MKDIRLDSPIENLPRTSPRTITRFKKIGIKSYSDLINYFPFRYENYSLISPISRVQFGEVVTIKGTLLDFKNVYLRNGRKIQKGILSDETGKIEVIWFNQPYLGRVFQPGTLVSVAGEVKGYQNSLSFEPKEYDVLEVRDQQTLHTGRLVPIYPEKAGISSRLLREKIALIFGHVDDGKIQEELEEFMPKQIIDYNNLVSEYDAYKGIHFPKDYDNARKATRRLGFDELFIIQLSAAIIKRSWQKEKVGHHFAMTDANKGLLKDFTTHLPFGLTNAQKRVTDEILQDLKKPMPMNRFLEGDVGSGKTVVAAIACYFSYLNGFQSLFMAPTEILALQHYRTISSLFKNTSVNVAIQTSSKKIHVGKDYDIIIGTQALIQKKINFVRVGLVIVDEQHRFGVRQRSLLKAKGINPHLLTMTATPIPRTIALTLYGELDLSVIDEMPKGRIAAKTYFVHKEKRDAGYEWIKKQIKDAGVQVFVICPLIEESEVETMKSAKAATKEFERLSKDIFPECRLALLHGKLASKQKEAIMSDFKNKKYDILVATSVVEVGIDIPNAAIMIIEAADRFGMAQLHQLRGRVGRGEKQSYCFLYSESESEETKKRLGFFATTVSGIKVAEYDFKTRGPGEIFGTRQHGQLNLKIASLSDYGLIDSSKKAAQYFIDVHADLNSHPEIKKRLEEYRIKQISRD